MSVRNSRENKKLRRLGKLIRPGVDSFIDLREWLRNRGYADTNAQAMKLILDGRVRSESHKLTDPVVPASMRGTLTVVSE